jgi:maltose O-acetyltransferase
MQQGHGGPVLKPIGVRSPPMQVPDLAEVRRTLRKVQKMRQRLRGEIDMEALVERGLQLGSNVYVAPWCLIDPVFPFLISIGDGCRLAPRVHVLAHDATSREALGYTRLAPVHIGRRVFVGADTLVLPGVTIGDDTVVGAGSLVSSDIPAGSLAVGRPARLVGNTRDLFERRRARIEAGPRFAFSDQDTPEGRARIRLQVEQAGEGYIP